jgi:hypothetical protein
MEDAPWATYQLGKPLNGISLGLLLKPHKIRSIQHRFTKGSNPLKGYSHKSFEAAWSTYLTDTPPNSAATIDTADTTDTDRDAPVAQCIPSVSTDTWAKRTGTDPIW